MTVDEHGGAEFQESLKAYVQTRYVDDLFGDDQSFQTKSSKDDVLIQVADFSPVQSPRSMRERLVRRSLKPISEYCVI